MIPDCDCDDSSYIPTPSPIPSPLGEGSKDPASIEFIKRMRASREARNGTASSPSFAASASLSASVRLVSSALALAAASIAAASSALAKLEHAATPTPDSNAVVTTAATPRDRAA